MVGLALVAVVATVGASGAPDASTGWCSASGRADLYVERRGLVRVSTEALERFLPWTPA